MNRLLVLLALALALALGLAACADTDLDSVTAESVVAPPPPISTVLADCAAPGAVGGPAAGTDLQRVNIDLIAFPDARCNDGTGAAFFFRPASTALGQSRWVIQLQGGGGCVTPDGCAKRWCSVATNFGMNQMSSSLLPAVGAVASGILFRGPAPNPWADYNQVLVEYCTSDTYAGHTGPLVVNALHPVTGAPVQFQIEFEGQAVLDAVIATLRRDGAVPPAYTLHGAAIALSDLDNATDVVLAGASAGGGGVINNVDRVGELLRASNTACTPNSCPLRYSALIDSTFGPSNERLDWSTSLVCASTLACTWQDVLAAGTSMYTRSVDASCAAWHALFAPATAWLCADTDHVLRNHLTTPFMLRQGLRDQLLSSNAIDAGVSFMGQPMTLPLFAQIVRDQLIALAVLPTTAEEGALLTRAPAVFGPPCPDHDTLSSNRAVFNALVLSGGNAYSMFDVHNNWVSGAFPQQVIYRPGDPTFCP